MDMQKKVAIVTGGGTGIGGAISEWLAARGAAVAVVYSRSEGDASATAARIQAQGGRAIAARADVTSQADVDALVERVAHELGRIDYLVNNAAITYHVPMDDLASVSDAIWDRLIDVNVKGAFRCARAVAPHMRQLGGGAIVNIGSIAGVMGRGSSLPYAVSKAALHSLTLSLAHALAPAIRVNCVAPGFVPTRWWEGHADTVQRMGRATLLQRVTQPAEIAEIVGCMLAQPATTGQLLVVDGGGFA